MLVVSICIGTPVGTLLQPFMILQIVDDGSDVAKDAVELTQTVDVMVYAFFGVPFNEGRCLVVINVEALLDSLLVVIAASALLSAE